MTWSVTLASLVNSVSLISTDLYLTGLCVTTLGATSSSKPVPSGVPQVPQVDNLDNWSSTSGINFNGLKCKCVRVTRKTHPVIFPYNINSKELANSSNEKDLGVWITSDLNWTKHVLDRWSNANKLLGYVRRSSREVSSTRTRRTLYLTVVRSALGYASQVWSPQFIGLIKRTERFQRRASKFMLNLPYLYMFGDLP